MRRLLFVLVVAAMALLALLLITRRGDPGAPSAPRASIDRPRPAAVPRPPSPSGPRRAARSFIDAFLDYEAGVRDPRTVAAIRLGSAPRLSRDVLATSPAARRARPAAPASLVLTIRRLPHRPDLALVSGTAHRPSGPEPFAFLFARRGARWLAVAPAE
jgi:hypothetical protein